MLIQRLLGSTLLAIVLIFAVTMSSMAQSAARPAFDQYQYQWPRESTKNRSTASKKIASQTTLAG